MHSALCISWQQPGEKQCGNHAPSCLELPQSIFIYDDMPICHAAFFSEARKDWQLTHHLPNGR